MGTWIVKLGENLYLTSYLKGGVKFSSNLKDALLFHDKTEAHLVAKKFEGEVVRV